MAYPRLSINVFVRPYLEYSVAAWSSWTDKDLEVQRKAIGKISNLGSKSYEERLAELGLQTLRKRRERRDLIKTYKIVSGISDVKPETWFQLQKDNARETRKNSKVTMDGEGPSVEKHANILCNKKGKTELK
jgi:hypothetical protein